MTYLLAGLIAVFVFSGGLNAFLSQPPQWLTQTMRKMAGGAALIFAIFLTSRGNWEGALPVAILGLVLSGLLRSYASFNPLHLVSGQTQMRTPLLEVMLNRSGEVVFGTVLMGPYQGKSLANLTLGELLSLHAKADPASASLLELYLNRLHTGWRKNREANAHGRSNRADSGLSEHEAYEILGLRPGAGEEAIRAAHRALMKKLHPDQGGTTYLATRVNQAKDILLSRHNRNS